MKWRNQRLSLWPKVEKQVVHEDRFLNFVFEYQGLSLHGQRELFGGGEVVSLYDQGAIRNIATFYQNIVESRCDNPTAQQAGDDALTAVLGREACARRCYLTMDELINENKALEFDLTGLKM